MSGGAVPMTIREVSVGAPPGAIDLSLGVPGWPMHQAAVEAMGRGFAESGLCGYGPNAGLPGLVAAIADHHQVDPAEVMATAGSQSALYALFAAHLPRTGGRVMIPDPGFPGYRSLAVQHDAEVLAYPLASDGSLDPDAFSQTLLRATRDRPGGRVDIAVLNHPGNPTGGGATAAALAQVAQLCADHDVLLISDEVYRELRLGEPQVSLREVCDTGVVVGSMSKAWAAPGLRIGWALGAPDLLAPARTVHTAMCTAPSVPAQYAAIALLHEADHALQDSWHQLIHRWSVAQTAPDPVRAGRTPVGGFYLWLPIPDWAHADPVDFWRRLRDQGGVIVVPGHIFGPGGRNHLRVSCGGDIDQLQEGLRRMNRWWSLPGGLRVPDDLRELDTSEVAR